MNIEYRQNNQPYGIEISDILETTETVIRVKLKDGGKPVSIRRDLADVFPGIVYIPRWLAVRILKPADIDL